MYIHDMIHHCSCMRDPVTTIKRMCLHYPLSRTCCSLYCVQCMCNLIGGIIYSYQLQFSGCIYRQRQTRIVLMCTLKLFWQLDFTLSLIAKTTHTYISTRTHIHTALHKLSAEENTAPSVSVTSFNLINHMTVCSNGHLRTRGGKKLGLKLSLTLQ